MTEGATRTLVTQIEEDKHWWFAGRTWALLNMIDRLVEPDGQKRVLDIGCGAGNMFHHLARYGSVVGVDNNPKPLIVARERGYNVREGSAEDLPFDDEAFDALISECSFCAFPDKAEAAVEMARVLRSGGRLGLADMIASGSLFEDIQTLLSWIACFIEAIYLSSKEKVIGSRKLQKGLLHGRKKGKKVTPVPSLYNYWVATGGGFWVATSGGF